MSSIRDNKDTFFQPVCNSCRHHETGIRCKAFKEIPDEILLGENNHSKPLKDQGNDIVFEKR